jgi:hypothetical protein
MFKSKVSKFSLALLGLMAIGAPAAYADGDHNTNGGNGTPVPHEACHPGWDKDCVETKATLVPAIHVKGLECLDFGKIAVCDYRNDPVYVNMNNAGYRTSTNNDLATPIGANGQAAKFKVTGSKGSEFSYTVTATDLTNQYYPAQKLYLTPAPTGDTSETFASGYAWETDTKYYQVAGKLTIPPNAQPGYYTGEVCLRAEYK